ncbi:RTA1 like protein-domain-containing protein [Amylocarpus encephaloides]|uniref:RTA1 like protein-domain-containing protein n=1 Tax=Amylocarpus encephaloides TaxID=45428 RepID=A0A9P8C1E1_9HELO|nr:RTA1 like protein-domain-containing protein [Amylocarpus encephaloides]
MSSRGGYIDPNFPNPNGPNDAPVIIYGYTPSYALAISVAALFSLALLIQLAQLYRYRAWYFSTVPLGLILEILGYIFRSFSANKDPYNVIYFVVQYFFIVCAPVFLSAGIYAVLSVLINRVGKEYSLLRPKLVLWIFITSDVLCTTLQVAGAAILGSAQSNRKDPNTGNHILTAGLAIQVFVFALFLILTALFFSQAWSLIWVKGRKSFIVSFVAATGCIYLRTCYRLAETAEGVGGRLFSSEGFFVGLEVVPVLVAVWLFCGWCPGRCLGKREGNEDVEMIGDGGGEGRK